jgi:hypothetical protein
MIDKMIVSDREEFELRSTRVMDYLFISDVDIVALNKVSVKGSLTIKNVGYLIINYLKVLPNESGDYT